MKVVRSSPLRTGRLYPQTISYEVRLAFILLSFVILVSSYNLAYFYFFSGLFVVNFSFSSFVVYLIYFLFS